MQSTVPEKKIATKPTREKSVPNQPRRPTAASELPRGKAAAPKTQCETPKISRARLASVPLADVIVGVRHRKAVGNIQALARSIAETGHLEPILVDAEMRLVDGQRRLLAAQELGLAKVPALVIDIEDPLLASVAVDRERKKLTSSEKYAVVEELLSRAKDPEWRGRALGGRLDGAARRGRLDEFVAAHVGLSRESLRKIRLIHERSREDEARFGDLARALDADGKVDRHFRELQRRLVRDGAEAARSILVGPNWTELGGEDLAKAVRKAELAARGGAGCLLLVPAPVAHVGEAARIVSLAGYRWLRTLVGEDGGAWLVGVLGRREEVPPDVAPSLAEGCAQGAEGVRVALEAAFGAVPLTITLSSD